MERSNCQHGTRTLCNTHAPTHASLPTHHPIHPPPAAGAGTLAKRGETLARRFARYAFTRQQLVGPVKEPAKFRTWQGLQAAGHPLYIRCVGGGRQEGWEALGFGR
jgi:hypothetical protein